MDPGAGPSARLAVARRRASATVLRWQARLDAPLADRLVPWLSAAGLSLLLALLSLARARSLDADPQLAVDVQAVWALRHGVTSVSLDGGTHVFAPHLSLLLWPVAQLTRVFPAQSTLLVLQATALGCAVVPLWLLARRVANLRVGAAAALLAAYALYPAVHGVNLSGFHVAAVALPLLLLAAWAGFEGRAVVLGIAVAVVLSARADLGLAVAGVGLVLALNGRRRLGAWTAGAGVAWTALATVVLQPALDGSSPHLRAFADYGDGAGEVAWGLLTSPGDVVGDLTAEANLDLLVLLLGPLLFLPVLVPRFLVGVVPVGIATLLATGPDDPLWSGRTVPVTALLFLATTFALHRLGREGVERVIVDRRLLIALVLASVTFFVQSGTASPYRRPWEWGGRDGVDLARLRAAEIVADDELVRAAHPMTLPLAGRRHLEWLDPDGSAVEAADDVDVVVLDAAATDLVPADVASRGFDVVFDEQGVVVLRRQPAP